jgi:hypothetical protein
VILALDENSGPDRWMRAVLRFQSSQPAGAAEDLDWIIEHEPAGVNLDEVRSLREVLRPRFEPKTQRQESIRETPRERHIVARRG